MAIRHRIVPNIPDIWRKERLSIFLQRKLEIMTLETVKTVNGIFKGMLNVQNKEK